MFNKVKRMMAVVVAAVMLTATFSGCSTKKTDGAKNPSAPTNTEKVPEKRGKITVSVYDRGACDAKEGNMTDNRWLKWINENGPVDVTFVTVPRWEATKVWPVLFASGTAPDLILEYDNNSRNSLYLQKQLTPLDDLIANKSVEYKKLTEKYPDMIKVGIKPDGKIYDFARSSSAKEGKTIAIRKDWLDKLNLKMPKTTEEFYDVISAFAKNDPDGNGKADTFGFNLAGPGQFAVATMFGMGTTGADWFQPWSLENDKLVLNWNKVRDYVEFQKRLFEAGVVDRDFLIDKNGDKATQDWANGKLGIMFSNKGATANDVLKSFMANNPNAEIAFMLPPTSKYGQFNVGIDGGASTWGSINAACKDPVSVMKYVDFMNSEKAAMYFKLGPEGKYYTKDPTGEYKVTDSNLKKLEFDYNGDIAMIISSILTDNLKFAGGDDELSKKKLPLDILKAQTYRIKTPQCVNTIANYPALTDELNISRADATKLSIDIISQTIVGGPSRTVDKCMEDLKTTWNKSGGEKIMEYYSKWYDENKKSAVTNKERYAYPFTVNP